MDYCKKILKFPRLKSHNELLRSATTLLFLKSEQSVIITRRSLLLWGFSIGFLITPSERLNGTRLLWEADTPDNRRGEDAGDLVISANQYTLFKKSFLVQHFQNPHLSLNHTVNFFTLT